MGGERHFAWHANTGEALLPGVGYRVFQQTHQGNGGECAGGKVDFVGGVEFEGSGIYVAAQ
jgi:hypothetical protein